MKTLESTNPLIERVTSLIVTAQGFVAKAVKKGIMLLYGNIGKTMQVVVIKSDRTHTDFDKILNSYNRKRK